MDLSIIIVNWNAKDYILNCIESIKENTKKINYEIIVVDNNSTDDSINCIRNKFSNVKLIENEENIGFSAANNRGIKIASGDYVLLLNPDTIIIEDALDKMVNYISHHKDIGILGPRLLGEDGKLRPGAHRSIPTPAIALTRILMLSKIFKNSKYFNKYNMNYLDENKIHKVEAVSGACMLIRRDFINEKGMLDEDYFMYGEDLDYCYKANDSKWEVVYYPKSVVIHYQGKSSSQQYLKANRWFNESMEIFYKKNLKNNYNVIVNFLVLFGLKFKSWLDYIKIKFLKS